MNLNAEKCVYIHISEAHKCDLKIHQISLQKVHNTSDLGVETCSNLKWSRHIRNKLTKAQRSFNCLRHNVPFSLPNKVKQILYTSCVSSIFLYASVAWFPDIGHLRLLEKFYWKGLCWCYGKRNYISALQYSDNIPICYQLIERDLRFFISIILGKTCIKFEDFFTLKINSRILRSEHSNQLVINPTIKQLTSKSYFKRVQVYVNDFNKTVPLNILKLPADHKPLLRELFVNLRDSQFDLNYTCTWSIRCRCIFCRS